MRCKAILLENMELKEENAKLNEVAAQAILEKQSQIEVQPRGPEDQELIQNLEKRLATAKKEVEK